MREWLRARPGACEVADALAATVPASKKKRRQALQRLMVGLMVARGALVAENPMPGAETAYAFALSCPAERSDHLEAMQQMLGAYGLECHQSATAGGLLRLASAPSRQLAFLAGQFYRGAHGAKVPQPGLPEKRLPDKALLTRLMSPEGLCMLWQELGAIKTLAATADGRLPQRPKLLLDTSHLSLKDQKRLAQALGKVFRFEVTICRDGRPLTAKAMRQQWRQTAAAAGSAGGAAHCSPSAATLRRASYTLSIHWTQAGRLARLLALHDPLRRLPLPDVRGAESAESAESANSGDEERPWMRALAGEAGAHDADVPVKKGGVRPSVVAALKPELSDGLHEVFVGCLLGNATMGFRHLSFKHHFCIPVYKLRLDKPLTPNGRTQMGALHATLEGLIRGDKGPREYGAGQHGAGERRLTMTTKMHQRFRFYYHSFFEVDVARRTLRKRVPQDIAQHMGPVAVAYWYADCGTYEGGVPSLRVDGYSQADAEQLRDALALRTGWCVEVRGEGRGRRLVLLSEGAADQIAAWQREAGIPTMQHSAPGGR